MKKKIVKKAQGLGCPNRVFYSKYKYKIRT